MLAILTAMAVLTASATTTTAAEARETDQAKQADQSGESMVVFVQPEASPLAKRFQAKHVAKVEALAKQMGVGFRVVDVTKSGAPERIDITPLIVYQNHFGRSVYQGRYTTLDRVKNFVRTSRFMPQGEADLVRENILVWTVGRAEVAAPIKITDLAGKQPASFDQSTFDMQMREAIDAGLKRFDLAKRVALSRTDRQFYMDFYPYRSADGTLSVTTALFSQFHCHEPIFTTLGKPVTGPWADRAALFAKAAGALGDEVARQLKESTLGDGFDVVPQSVTTVTWDELALQLPPKPAGAANVDTANIKLVEQWNVDTKAQQDRPAVQFAFPAPLDSYTGQVGSLTGQVALGNGPTLAGMNGTFTAKVDTVTMGERDLDAAIHFDMLKAGTWPASSFTFERVDAPAGAFEFGQTYPVVLHGKFTMMDKTIDLSVATTVEAFVAPDGRPRISIDGQWKINIAKPFGIDGPPGPDKASSTLIYRCHIVLEPK